MSVLVAKDPGASAAAPMSLGRRRFRRWNTGEHVLNTGGSYPDVSGSKYSIALTKNEYRILQALMEHKGQIVVSREQLMEAGCGRRQAFVDDNTLTVNVNRLRRKLDAGGPGRRLSPQNSA